jgi:Icc-related predicted phosphoesterase
MRLQLLSDLHFEFHPDHGRSFVESLDPSGVDVLVVAGDLAVGDGLIQALNLLCARYRNSRVAYVLGNHESYGSNPIETIERVKAAEVANPNLIWLDCSDVTFLHYPSQEKSSKVVRRTLGATLWFPRDDSNLQAKACLTDFSAIEDFEPWVYQQNRRAVGYLQKELQPGDIVVTHHLPSPQCIAPQHVGSPLNPYFVCDMTDLIMQRKPSMWMFGHTHSSVDIQIGETRMLCNPLGYLGSESNSEFDSHLIVEA